VIRDHVRGIDRTSGRWRFSGLEARWLIDASGPARATLRSIADLGRIDELHGASRHAYVSLRFGNLLWPARRLGHAARGAGVGLIARRVSDAESLVTLQLADVDRPPASADAFLDLAEVADFRFCSENLRPASVVGNPSRWTCRRASGLDACPDRAPSHWFAVGDALLTTPPHQGQGIAQLSRQIDVMADCLLDPVAGWEAARERLLGFARSKLIAATLADTLGTLAGARPPSAGSLPA
jgi:2-polyprenyl-6-methoxyphenol hydroxylase-like FAD-dependent oxidoreductase